MFCIHDLWESMSSSKVIRSQSRKSRMTLYVFVKCKFRTFVVFYA